MKPHVQWFHGEEGAVRRVFGVIEWAPSNRRLAVYLWVWRHFVIVALYLDGDPNEAWQSVNLGGRNDDHGPL